MCYPPQQAWATEPAVDDLLACGYSRPDSKSEGALSVNRDRYPFCHILSAGQVVLYWTHAGYARQHSESESVVAYMVQAHASARYSRPER